MGQSRILLSPPHLCGREMAFTQEALASNWVAPVGPHLEGFEQDVVAFTSCGHALAVNSGTSAIHLALTILGVGKDDFVLCPTLTFTASAAPIIYQGAQPVFVDSEKSTFNMCPVACEEAIVYLLNKGAKPKAMLVVHLYGMPAQIDQLFFLSQKYNIPLIEDAAESLGSRFRGKACGTFGDLGIFSFNGNKIITTGGGGMLVSENPERIGRAKYLSTHARELVPHYHHEEVGFNYRLSNINAGIGRAQMTVLEERIQSRRKNFEIYQSFFSNIEGISFQKSPNEDHYSNRWLTAVLLDPKVWNIEDKVAIADALEEANIETRPLWKPLHLQPAYSGAMCFGGDVAERLFEQGLCLPSGSAMGEDEFERIFKVLERMKDKMRARVSSAEAG